MKNKSFVFFFKKSFFSLLGILFFVLFGVSCSETPGNPPVTCGEDCDLPPDTTQVLPSDSLEQPPTGPNDSSKTEPTPNPNTPEDSIHTPRLEPGSFGCNPKNVIMMVCDGCGFNQFIASDYYHFGEKEKQAFYRFPVSMAMSTHHLQGNSYDSQAAQEDPKWVWRGFTDSGASATALSTGVKTNKQRIGFDQTDSPVPHAVEVAYQTGRASGVVTSMPISHATPAGFVAHIHNRNRYEVIAPQMIFESTLNVLLGTGHPYYDNNGFPRTNPDFQWLGGDESVYLQLKAGTAQNLLGAWTFIDSKEDFDRYLSLSSQELPEQLLGIAPIDFSLQVARTGGPNELNLIVGEHPKVASVPDLRSLSTIALNVLAKNEKGFYLMIEGGAIDEASHNHSIARVIEEIDDFNNAVDGVVQWIEQHGGFNDNLLIITADHETGYLIGPNAYDEETGFIDYELVNNGVGQIPGHSFNSTAHTNQLVPLFAKGGCDDKIQTSAVGTDFRHGSYSDNAVLGALVQEILKSTGHSH